ncbi:MAG: S41 family peptidase [Planctomycetota bacterium]|nr:MAG: S41 family peptidase [Planctomycetota bacterium]
MTVKALLRRTHRPIALALALALWPSVGQADPPAPATDLGPISVADLAQRVWRSAEAGRPDEAFALLEAIPDRHEVQAVADLKAALERRNAHLAEAQDERLTRLGEAWDELAQHAGDDDPAEALRLAVEISSLAEDKASVLVAEPISALVARAEASARRAEAEGRWLDAQEILFRLNLLYDEDGRYEDDLTRASTRLMMIRLYAPQRLHAMRDAARVAEGLDPLPPFNGMGEDWREKLAGIDDPNVIVRAINHAQLAHVDGASMADMLLGGLDNLRTLVTTTDVAPAFGGIRDPKRVEAFLDEIARLETRLRTRGQRADTYDLTRTLRKIIDANAATVDVDLAAVLHEFGNGAMARLDQFSAIIWPDELRQFQKTTQARFTGVGIQIQLDDAQRLKVVTPLEGTPAHKAGILPGDIITAVDGESTIGITLTGAVERITGERGTPVTLTVDREGADEPIDFNLVRDEIPIHSVKGWRRNGPHETDWDWFIDRDNGIGYVRVTQFADGVTREFDRAVRQMREVGLEGLILDLRFNPGGLLNEAVDLANRFLSDGVIVSQHDADGRAREVQRARRGGTTLADLPVVVLINEGSASASEIVAGALQDHKRAVLVGARTFGKGSVQNVYDIGRGLAALRLTIQYYRLPSGRLIHRRPGMHEWGIEPDVAVDMPPARIGEALRLRQDADVLPINEKGEVVLDGDAPDPGELLTTGVDMQLETALLLVQSQSVARKHGLARALAEAPAPAAHVGG